MKNLQVNEQLVTWHDALRDRELPVKIYWPEFTADTAFARYPLILFSHGLGGTREGYAYLGRFWASQGMVVVHVQHHGSDDAVWRGNPKPGEAMRKALASRENAINRPLDIQFAISHMLEADQDSRSPFYHRLDRQTIGAAGHSFGAYTVMAIGSQLALADEMGAVALHDVRVKAIIPLSPSIYEVAIEGKSELESSPRIVVPALHMTGTRDRSPLGATLPAHRRIPFDQSSDADSYLLTLKDADHMAFTGSAVRIGYQGSTSSTSEFERQEAARHAVIQQFSLAFWQAYLQGDQAAVHWLNGQDAQQYLAGQGTFEAKRP